MLYSRIHGFSVETDAAVGLTFARVKECLEKAEVDDTPLRFCFHGSRGCAEILARFPELRRFLSTAGPQVGAAPDEHLSNFGPLAPGALAGPSGDVVSETITAIVEGIPTEFPISSVTLAIGPIPQDLAPVALSSKHTPFKHTPFPDISTLFAQCVTLMWQSVTPRNGQRYSLVVFEPLPTDDATQPVQAWIQALYSAFPGSAEKIASEIDLKTSEYGMVVTCSDKSFIGSKSIADDLKLPHQLPDSKATLRLKYAPLRGVRSMLTRAFADDGWKQPSARTHAGIYELWKLTPHRRRLGLMFRIQNPNPSSRNISCTMQLVSEGGTKSLRVLAERSTRREFAVPNPKVFGQVLDNMHVVVKHLENTWLAELEESLGPVPPDHKVDDE
jgi:hypothetical protein